MDELPWGEPLAFILPFQVLQKWHVSEMENSLSL